MPETVAETTFATLLIGLLVLLSEWGTRRWGTRPEPEPLVGVWHRVRALRGGRGDARMLAAADRGEGGGRRGLFRRRRGEPQRPPEADPAAPEETETPEGGPGHGDEAQTVGAEAPAPRSSRPPLDYVPFEAAARRGDGGAEDGGRFRRALRKTREYLNRDVSEAFGSGPVPEAFESLEEALVRADVGVTAATYLADELRERGRELTAETLSPSLKDVMRSYLGNADRRLRVNPEGLSVWLVVGVNGTGKTTSIAKLAHHAKSQGFTVCIGAADTYRAAAIEQLQRWGERIGVEVVRQHPGADPGAVVYDGIERCKARGYDLLICDTAGRLHTRKPLMEELRKVHRVVERHEGLLTECLLVLDATTGQNGIAQARAFKEAVEVTGLVLAKLDSTAKGGVVFGVERELSVPVKVIGTGEKPEDLAPFDPDDFVDALL